MKWIVRSLLLLAVLVMAATGVFFGIRADQQHRLTRLQQVPPDFYVTQRASHLVLDHVKVLDGTGAPAKTDQSIVIEDGKITYAGPASERPPVSKAATLDLRGRSVLPGLVGMHEHLFTTAATWPGSSTQLVQQSTVSRLLYLASGVTTIRTAGSIAPEADIALKKQIDGGAAIGPEIYLTAPYLEGAPPSFPEMRALAGPEDARRAVRMWAAHGMSLFKAYMMITPEELQAAIETAHSLGLKMTGHLCTIGLEQAAKLGIDNIEHGFITETALYSGKKPNECPKHLGAVLRELNATDIQSEKVQHLIRELVDHHVAITSTLAVLESELSNHTDASEERRRGAMTWEAWRLSQMRRNRIAGFHLVSLLQKEMEFERAFVHAGGRLLAGCDSTGDGSVLAGFGDQRELELLVKAGFAPAEAVKIATLNGAAFLGIDNHTGTIQVGKDADLIIVEGDIESDIMSIENTELVFRHGIGYDSSKIVRDVQGVAGLAD